MKLRKIMAVIFMLCAFAAGRAMAASIDFKFEIPTIPYPPQIADVSNSAAAQGAASFTVTASIAGQMQMKGYCDIEPREDCTASDWYQAADTEVVPNPPTIQNVKLYYYKNDNVAGASSVDMTYDTTMGKYKGSVPIGGAVVSDTFTYYIVAIDSRGNVASQTPNTSQRPCPSSSSWDSTLATPATNNCSYASSYTRCNKYVSGTPGPCSTSYTVGDINGDVCGEPGKGNCGDAQCVISGADADKVDILGISAGADGTYICANMGLKAPTPSGSDNAPIEGYLAIFFDPDKFDPNPGDTHITNANAITYAPEAVGSEPTLVKVLWSGDCVTNPDTANPLDCKLISAVGASDDLKIEYGSGSLKYIVKKSGTGNPLAVPYSMLGASTKQAVIVGLTGEINLSGGTAFWISDLTPGFAYYQTNKTVPVVEGPPPAPPIITSTRCSVDGNGGTSSQCPQSATKPAQNKCKINFNKSMDVSFTTEYRIYRNSVDNSSTAVKVDAPPETGAETYSYTDTHTNLEGQTIYYYLTSYNDKGAEGKKEVKMSDASKTTCTVEDWKPPEKPVITKAATPPGNEKKCKIEWSITQIDTSLVSFYLSRSDDGGATYTPLNDKKPLNADPNSLSYTWTDDTCQDMSKTYKYTVTAKDRGGNNAVTDPADCKPEDLKSPAQVSSLLATNYGQSLIGVKAEWPTSAESDLGGYNLYGCRLNNKAVDCRSSASFSKLNATQLTANNFKVAEDILPSMFSEAGDYCFYAEACDNCAAEGTCQSNPAATSNCSGFPAGGADSKTFVKCLPLSIEIDKMPPAFPTGLACSAPPEGGGISITWDHICHDFDGTAFSTFDSGAGTCPDPETKDLVAYKLIYGDRGAVPKFEDANALNIAGRVTLSGADPAFTHDNLVNGKEYCYTVYGIDDADNFSKDGTAYPISEKCCTPKDLVAPAKPVIKNIDFTSISCIPAWSRVEDKDPLTYNLYRCKGSEADCATKNKFGVAIKRGITDASGLNYSDYDLTMDQEYQYCVTAEDPSGNESPVVEATHNVNCKTCTPSDRPPPVTGVRAEALLPENNTGVKLYWDKNKTDEGNGGYYVYCCSEQACANKGTAVKSCIATLPTETSPLTIDGEPNGDWYYGVTYRKDCGDGDSESRLETGDEGSIGGPVNVNSCTKCIVVSSCTNYSAGTGCVAVNRIDTSAKGADGKFAVTGVSGYQVYLVDSSGNIIGNAATTDSKGNYKINIGNDDSSISLSDKYKLVLKVPEAEKGGTPCSPGFSGSDCYIALESTVTVTDDGVIRKVSGINLPPVGGGRAEAGNPNCDNAIDVQDLLVFKDTFGGSTGDAKYKTYADFDGDGKIDVEDFLIFKKNFGKTLDAAPTFDAALCKPK